MPVKYFQARLRSTNLLFLEPGLNFSKFRTITEKLKSVYSKLMIKTGKCEIERIFWSCNGAYVRSDGSFF